MKTSSLQRLNRSQLSDFLIKEKKAPLHISQEGWIRTLREALGMSATQLANRLGVTKQGVGAIERAEREGRITFSTYKKVAEALDCDVRVTVVPRRPLENIVREQAFKAASQIVERSQLYMKLEDQGTDKEFRHQEIERLAEEMIRTGNSRIWNVS